MRAFCPGSLSTSSDPGTYTMTRTLLKFKLTCTAVGYRKVECALHWNERVWATYLPALSGGATQTIHPPLGR
jgi:hypothetical protein